MKIGLLPLGRPTFDVPFAQEKLAAMLAHLQQPGVETYGPQTLLMDMEAGRAAIDELANDDIDRLLVLQVTFTDASLIVEAKNSLDCPLAIWAIPEPRLGGRLRLNSFCGLNLASHALSLGEQDFNWLYRSPEDVSRDELMTLLDAPPARERPELEQPGSLPAQAHHVINALANRKIGRIGMHPDGFHTCQYSPATLQKLAGVNVEEIALSELFDEAEKCDAGAVHTLLEEAKTQLDGLEETNQGELDRSLRLKLALDHLKETRDLSAFAIRCWPETFTEYGGAVCGPVSMLGEARVPCACEADVMGALTQMILQECSDSPVFLTDIVDVDGADDTAVVWHCGQAPRSMCAEKKHPRATIHTNRKMPLLYEFALKPGTVTFMRISQGFNGLSMVLGAAEMLDRPMAFTGTSGVLRFSRPADKVLDDMINCGLEHHVAIAYGDHRDTLRGVAAAMNLPILEL